LPYAHGPEIREDGMSVGAVHLDFFHEDGFGFEAISGANELKVNSTIRQTLKGK
jgi:hypothetical protein